MPPAWRAERLLRSARSAWIVGAGGRAFGEALRAAPEWSDGVAHPADRFTRRAALPLLASLRDAGHAAVPLFSWERRDGRFADFVALARAAGVGAPSRLGVLLHPRYGPWLSLRAVVLSDAPPPPARAPDFDPCRECAAPCTDACPTGAPTPGGFDLASCRRGTRENPPCRSGCAARRACPVGAGHRYLPEIEAHHRRAALAHGGG